MTQSLGDRMKGYESCTCSPLPINTPVILRVDGRAFHTFARRFEKPFDNTLIEMMNEVARALMNEIMNARFAYIQSDEISILIYDKVDSDVWFGNKPQKMTSISAAIASVVATNFLVEHGIKHGNKALFDSRVFSIPEKDVTNYFIWRQRDWERNSIQLLAREYFSHKELHGKNTSDIHEMLHKKGVNWNDLPIYLKRGRCIYGDTFDECPPIFTEDRNYVESHLILEVDEC